MERHKRLCSLGGCALHYLCADRLLYVGTGTYLQLDSQMAALAAPLPANRTLQSLAPDAYDYAVLLV